MDIDYEFQLVIFKSRTGVNSDDIALKFLNDNDWDEEKSANAYFKSLDEENKGNSKEEKKIGNINNTNLDLNEYNYSNSSSEVNKSKGNDYNQSFSDILGMPKEKSFESVSL